MSMYYKKILFFVLIGFTISNYKTYGIQNEFQTNLSEKERQETLNKNTNEVIQEIAPKIIDMSYQIRQLSEQIQQLSSVLKKISTKVGRIHDITTKR